MVISSLRASDLLTTTMVFGVEGNKGIFQGFKREGFKGKR